MRARLELIDMGSSGVNSSKHIRVVSSVIKGAENITFSQEAVLDVQELASCETLCSSSVEASHEAILVPMDSSCCHDQGL